LPRRGGTLRDPHKGTWVGRGRRCNSRGDACSAALLPDQFKQSRVPGRRGQVQGKMSHAIPPDGRLIITLLY
jgi:hypothetical protein